MNILIKDAVQVKMQATVLVYEIGGYSDSEDAHYDFSRTIQPPAAFIASARRVSAASASDMTLSHSSGVMSLPSA